MKESELIFNRETHYAERKLYAKIVRTYLEIVDPNYGIHIQDEIKDLLATEDSSMWTDHKVESMTSVVYGDFLITTILISYWSIQKFDE
jgi:hypothetical protein